MAQDVTIAQSLRRSLETLSRPITSLQNLHSTLSDILHDLGSTSASELDKVGKSVFLIQKEILEKILPVWRPALKVKGEELKMIRELFVPPTTSSSGLIKGKGKEIRFNEAIAITIALSTFQTVSNSMTTKIKPDEITYLLDVLQDLLTQYPFDRIYTNLFLQPNSIGDRANDLNSQTYTSTLLRLPGKVGNVLGRLRFDGQGGGSQTWEWDDEEFWAGIARGVEEVIWTMSSIDGMQFLIQGPSPAVKVAE